MKDVVDTTLVLSFEPDAIRQHFEGDDDAVAVWVESATDAELKAVGHDCISADTLYREFHRLLDAVVTEHMESGD